MQSLHRLNLYRNTYFLLEKYVKPTIAKCYSNFPIESANLEVADQFKAAVLHPKKQNLTIETLVLPETAADGMVLCNAIDTIDFSFSFTFLFAS